MKVVVLDTEVRNDPEVVGWENFKEMGISVLVMWCSWLPHGLYVYGEDELDEAHTLMMEADITVTFAGDRFDLPLLRAASGLSWLPKRHIDVLLWLQPRLGVRPKLGMVTLGTLGRGKTGSGADVPKWWAEGKVFKIARYCGDDVILLRDAYLHAERFGYVVVQGDFGPPRLVHIRFTHAPQIPTALPGENEHFVPPTQKQIDFLRRLLGSDDWAPDSNMTNKDVSAQIDRLLKDGRKP